MTCSSFSFNVMGKEVRYKLLPDSVSLILFLVFSIALLVSFIMVIIKLCSKNKIESVEKVSSSELKFISEESEKPEIDFMMVDKNQNIDKPVEVTEPVLKENKVIEETAETNQKSLKALLGNEIKETNDEVPAPFIVSEELVANEEFIENDLAIKQPKVIEDVFIPANKAEPFSELDVPEMESLSEKK